MFFQKVRCDSLKLIKVSKKIEDIFFEFYQIKSNNSCWAIDPVVTEHYKPKNMQDAKIDIKINESFFGYVIFDNVKVTRNGLKSFNKKYK